MKKHTLTLAFFALGLGVNAQLPNHHWTKSADGGALAKGFCITSDYSGNVYTAGVFTGTNDFDPSAGTSNLTSYGGDDIFIVKSNPQGEFIWAKNIGGSQADVPKDITVDTSGNIYLTGHFSGTADFNTGAGVTNLISSGGTDAFITKLDPMGELVWAKSIGGTADDFGNSLSIRDYDGSVFIIGSFAETIDFNPSPDATAIATSNGSTDVFMLRLSNDGIYLTFRTVGGIGADRGNGIFVDPIYGDQFLTGIFSGTVDFDPGPGVYEMTGSNDVFILKLGFASNISFSKSMGGIGVDEGINIAGDANGFIYVHGSFNSTCNFNTNGGTTNVTSNGSDDVFVAQLIKLTGSFNWVRTFGSTGTEDFMDMSVNRFGRIYLTGEMAGDMDANPDPVGVNTLIKKGAEDAYIISLGNNGIYNWSTSYGVNDPAVYTRGFGIHADDQNNVYTTGSFYSTVDFDPTLATLDISAVSGSDIWYQKLGPGTNGINKKDAISSLNLSPNPSSGVFTLSSDYMVTNAEITVLDMNGKVIQQVAKKDFKSINFNLEDVNDGIYFLTIKSEGLNEVVKLVKR